MEIETQDNVFTPQINKPNKTVHFGENIDIPVDVAVKQQTDTQSKNKARRRARTSSSGSKDEDEEATARPIAPSKLRKLAEKDRHVSRSGKGRGKPKKGQLICNLKKKTDSNFYIAINFLILALINTLFSRTFIVSMLLPESVT